MIGRSFLNLQSFSHHKAFAVVLIREVADGYEASNQALDLLQQLLIVICMNE